MCKFEGWQYSQASEVTKSRNTVNISNKLKQSFSSPKVAANPESTPGGVPFRFPHWLRPRRWAWPGRPC